VSRGGVILPLPGEPDERVEVVLTQLRIARDSLSIAEERVAKVKAWAADPLISWPDEMMLRILRQGRELEETLWAREVQLLEQALKVLGVVHP
jgi:hypothetical protein